MSCLYSSKYFQSGCSDTSGVFPRAGKVLFRIGEGGRDAAAAAAASAEKKPTRKREKLRMEGADQPLSAKKEAAEQRRQEENRALAKDISDHLAEQEIHDEVRAALAEARRRRQEEQDNARIDEILARISGSSKKSEVKSEPPSEIADQVVQRILEKADVSPEDEQIDAVLDRIEKGKQKPVLNDEVVQSLGEEDIFDENTPPPPTEEMLAESAAYAEQRRQAENRALAKDNIEIPKEEQQIHDEVRAELARGHKRRQEEQKRAFDKELSGFLDSLAAQRETQVGENEAFVPDTSEYITFSPEALNPKPSSAIERLKAQKRSKAGELFPAADLASPNFEIPKKRVFGPDAEPEIDAALERTFPTKPKNELPPNWREMFANQNEREGAGIDQLDSDLLEEVDDEEDIPELDSSLLQNIDEAPEEVAAPSPQDLTPPQSGPSLLQRMRDSKPGRWVLGALAAIGLTSALNRDIAPAAQAPDRAVAAASKKAEAPKPVETPRRVVVSGSDRVTVVPPAPSPFSPESVSKVQSEESQKAPETVRPQPVRREARRTAEPRMAERRSDAQRASEIEIPPDLITLAPDFRGRKSFVEGESLFKDLNGSVVEVKFEGGRPKEILIAPKDGGKNGEFKVQTSVMFDRAGRAFSKGKRAEAFDGLASRAQSEFNRLLNL